jgi:hypothetical protein
MDRDGELPFHIYRHGVQQTREIGEQEVERLFGLSRLRDRDPELEPEMESDALDLEIPSYGSCDVKRVRERCWE